jgi:putative glutamine amidotransferase
MTSPLIGVTTHGVDRRGDVRLPATYVAAVRRAGGAPVLLPSGGDDALAVLPRLDGLVLTGGSDVDPAHFGQEAHPEVYGIDPDRDRSDLAFVHAARSAGLPMLAICRGMQVVNVALGGTLHQHVPDVVDGSVSHRADPPGALLHDVTVDASSQLAEVMGALTVRGMSWHHQAVDELGKGLRPVAHAPDGIVEAVAMDDHPWCLVVQWHPELSAHSDATQQRLFDGLVAAASQRAAA